MTINALTLLTLIDRSSFGIDHDLETPMHHLRSMTTAAYASVLLASIACGGSQQSAEAPTTPEAPPADATAAEGSNEAASAGSTGEAKTVEVKFEPKSGSTLSGTAKLTETDDGVKVVATLEHVAPGEHGAHVHAKGDCSAPDGSSAGDHFNPTSHPHALPDQGPRHLGDLGNVTIGADGTGAIDIAIPGANLKDGDPSSFLGKAIIVHEKKDDGGQPSGNAGGRIGCAVIQ
jgi:Cu-Zn family superoxide dismutase